MADYPWSFIAGMTPPQNEYWVVSDERRLILNVHQPAEHSHTLHFKVCFNLPLSFYSLDKSLKLLVNLNLSII